MTFVVKYFTSKKECCFIKQILIIYMFEIYGNKK